MAIKVVFYEEDGIEYVSHGVDTETLQDVTLPPEEKRQFIRENCRMCPEHGLVIKDTPADYEPRF